MEIILAENHGFCYGVKRAVEMANEAAEGKGKSYTLGPIIHNPQVVGRLESKGVSPIQEVADIDEGTMIIRSHGVGPAIYEEAEEKGITYCRCYMSSCKKSTTRCEVCHRRWDDFGDFGRKKPS